MFGSILVPIDGSDHASRALEIAISLLGEKGDLHLINVQTLPRHDYGVDGASIRAALDSAAQDRLQQQGERVLERVANPLSSSFSVHRWVYIGSPAHIIVDEAERLKVDAIVIGSRGLSDFRGLVVGSVSHRVSHTAPCTVISVHAAPDADDEAS
ncbi:universal stress protein [Kushneria phosphatilytica]|uniref:Universal stress protein n=1 Tax=Kushneria phosphatilytica TaxID=657387 RepID=A0A5C1A3U5_9GAMM|nr:universal stress protein [Kushneria phosphatilytica]QEL11729.1 universal stress protein [Kushneria phosphatilytica]